MSETATWTNLSKQAMKILGPKGKILKIPEKARAAEKAEAKKREEMDRIREMLKAKILECQDANAARKDSISQYQD